MKRKFIMFLASFSLVAAIIIPAGSIETAADSNNNSLVTTMGHGTGGGG